MMLSRDNIILRSWSELDKEGLLKHANNINVQKHQTDEFPTPYTVDDSDKWIDSNRKPDRIDRCFAIVVDGVTCGGIDYARRKGHHLKTANIGYWIGEEYWNKKIMTKAVGLLCDHLLNKTDIVRVQAHVFPWNNASIRVLEKNGFVLEGTMRNSAIKAGKVVDELLYAKVKE